MNDKKDALIQDYRNTCALIGEKHLTIRIIQMEREELTKKAHAIFFELKKLDESKIDDAVILTNDF